MMKPEKSPRVQRVLDTLAATIVGGAFLGLVACGAGGIVCKVVDLADQACPLVVQFAESDGGPKATVEITNDDAREMSRMKAERARAKAWAAAAADAGK